MSSQHLQLSAVANAGVAEEIRMKLTGHSSKAMNTRYTHLEIGMLKNAVTSLPLFGKEEWTEKILQSMEIHRKPCGQREGISDRCRFLANEIPVKN